MSEWSFLQFIGCTSLPVQRWCRAYPCRVSGVDLVFQHDLDFSRAIVWDAIVDPVLLEGWLADAVVDPRIGGRFRLDWIEPNHLAPFVGEIVELEEGAVLCAAAGGLDSLRFELAAVPGGSRGESTVLTVTVASALDARFAPAVIAHWGSNLEQLTELLRGHPVDWANWERDRGESWDDRVERARRDSSL